MSLSTKEIVRQLIKAHQSQAGRYLSKVLAVLSQRPFNMKGQEIEEIIGLLVKQGLTKEFNQSNPVVEVPQSKSAADIIFNFDGKRTFEIKSYGGATRFQLSTLQSILQDIRNKFKDSKPKTLNQAEKDWLLEKVKSVQIDYTLSFLSFNRPDNKISIHVFDHESLDISRFAGKDFSLKIVGKEERPEIHCNITDSSYLEVSAGGNPYNRGMWINHVVADSDMDKIYQTGLIEQVVPVESIELKTFDKNDYVLNKAARTVEIIEKYF